MSKVGAILLDTRSIQKYVFGCNKLKTNVGASFLVDDIFKYMERILKQSGLVMPKTTWQKTTNVQMATDTSIEAEVAYIGGGNMLVLVRKEGEDTKRLCRRLVSQWTQELLVKAPGLRTGAAIGELDLSEGAFKESLGQLYRQLKGNQNKILPQVDLPDSGMTIECDISGKVATVNDIVGDTYRWISAEVKAKTMAFRMAKEAVEETYKDILGTTYCLADDFNDLGYRLGESYISVVHIDGNNMGVKFGKCESMQERKELSMTVARIVREAFGEVLASMVAEYDSYAGYLDLPQGEKRTLPIRPIIIGGDDITFVCPGRLGVILTKRFIEAVTAKPMLTDEQHRRMAVDTVLSKTMSCCGGVAIVPAKYPFFRAYELAEQLCSVAKAESRADDNSLMEFAFLHGELYPSVEQLRRHQYVGVEGLLHYGPYSVVAPRQDGSHIQDVISLAIELQARVPENKIKKLREVLTQDAHTQRRYMERSRELAKLLGEMNGQGTAEALWQEATTHAHGTQRKTRYMDAIELIDYLPR